MINSTFSKIVLYVVFVLCTIIAITVTIYMLYIAKNNEAILLDLLKENFRPLIGIPWTAVTAFVLVSLFVIKSGKVDLTLGNYLKFSGAGDPIIM